MRVFESHSEEETEDIARALSAEIADGDKVALCGGLGAGKTVFARGLVSGLAPECVRLVHSPSFALVNEYAGDAHRIYHFDFYRLNDADDLYSIGFFDYLDGGNIIVAEWSEPFAALLPPFEKRVRIEKSGEGERRIYADFGD